MNNVEMGGFDVILVQSGQIFLPAFVILQICLVQMSQKCYNNENYNGEELLWQPNGLINY